MEHLKEFKMREVDRRDRPLELCRYLLDNLGAFSMAQINELIEDVWLDTEFPEIHRDAWDHLMTLYIPNHNVTEPLRVYRGTSIFNKRMWSWTTSKTTAEWFAKRNYGFSQIALKETAPNLQTPASMVLEGVINPEGILFTSNDRQEHEVVINGGNYWKELPKPIKTITECLY